MDFTTFIARAVAMVARRKTLSPARRLLMSTTYCHLCGRHVPILHTVESPTLGHICATHGDEPSERLRAVA
jgi:hypothetical protein